MATILYPHADTPAAAPFIAVSNLRKQYADGRTVIDDLSLTAAPGEFISVLGESGCGKSTLLKMIAGLNVPSGGTIGIAGRAPQAARDLMSFVFQEPTLLPWRTVAGNVALALEFERGGRPERTQKVDAVLQRVALSQVARYFPRQLSGGMKMRVSIARALATTPRLLLMDEPFGALDAMTRQRLNEELLAIHAQQGWTCLFVTHSVAEAVFLSDRILLMGANPGRVHQEIAVPLPKPRTAALRSEPAFLNLVAAVSRALGSDPRMKPSSWRLPLLTLCAVLALWEGVVVLFKVPDYLVPSPVQIALLIPTRLASLLPALAITGGEALGGFLLSALVGVAVSLGFSSASLVRRALYPYVVLLQTIPIIAISPLILLWLGNGSLSVLFISFLISIPGVIVNTTQGLISIDANLLDLFRMGNASMTTVLFKLRLPHALPQLFVGLKIAAGASVVGALVGETFAGSSALGAGGLGYSAIYALSQLDTPYLFVLILTSSLLGLTFFLAVSAAERLMVGHWHDSFLAERAE